MPERYYVGMWALRREAEIVDLPGEIEIHPDYLKLLPREKILAALQSIHRMLHRMYRDIAENPGTFQMPMVPISAETLTKYGFPPPEANTSKRAPYMLPDALINVLICGEPWEDVLAVNPERLVFANKNYKAVFYKDYTPKSYAIKNVSSLYAAFDRYGLYLEGLKDFKLTSKTQQLTLCCPDEPHVLTVLKWMADKAHRHDRRQDFFTCHYKLLQDDMASVHYGMGVDYLADKTHTAHEAECAYAIDAALRGLGLHPVIDNRGEPAGEDGYAIYYAREKDGDSRDKSDFKLFIRQTKLGLALRIKHAQSCAAYIAANSDTIKAAFIPGDRGCGQKHRCSHGQAYTIDGTDYWHCGCCGARFEFEPSLQDIPAYSKLVELGKDR